MTDAAVQELIDKHGEQTVAKAFWLQQEIKKRGLDGIYFKEDAEAYTQRLGGLVTRNNIQAALDRRY